MPLLESAKRALTFVLPFPCALSGIERTLGEKVNSSQQALRRLRPILFPRLGFPKTRIAQNIGIQGGVSGIAVRLSRFLSIFSEEGVGW
jgi:hypothetical protein